MKRAFLMLCLVSPLLAYGNCGYDECGDPCCRPLDLFCCDEQPRYITIDYQECGECKRACFTIPDCPPIPRNGVWASYNHFYTKDKRGVGQQITGNSALFGYEHAFNRKVLLGVFGSYENSDSLSGPGVIFGEKSKGNLEGWGGGGYLYYTWNQCFSSDLTLSYVHLDVGIINDFGPQAVVRFEDQRTDGYRAQGMIGLNWFGPSCGAFSFDARADYIYLYSHIDDYTDSTGRDFDDQSASVGIGELWGRVYYACFCPSFRPYIVGGIAAFFPQNIHSPDRIVVTPDFPIPSDPSRFTWNLGVGVRYSPTTMPLVFGATYLHKQNGSDISTNLMSLYLKMIF